MEKKTRKSESNAPDKVKMEHTKAKFLLMDRKTRENESNAPQKVKMVERDEEDKNENEKSVNYNFKAGRALENVVELFQQVIELSRCIGDLIRCTTKLFSDSVEFIGVTLSARLPRSLCCVRMNRFYCSCGFASDEFKRFRRWKNTDLQDCTMQTILACRCPCDALSWPCIDWVLQLAFEAHCSVRWRDSLVEDVWFLRRSLKQMYSVPLKAISSSTFEKDLRRRCIRLQPRVSGSSFHAKVYSVTASSIRFQATLKRTRVPCSGATCGYHLLRLTVKAVHLPWNEMAAHDGGVFLRPTVNADRDAGGEVRSIDRGGGSGSIPRALLRFGMIVEVVHEVGEEDIGEGHQAGVNHPPACIGVDVGVQCLEVLVASYMKVHAGGGDFASWWTISVLCSLGKVVDIDQDHFESGGCDSIPCSFKQLRKRMQRGLKHLRACTRVHGRLMEKGLSCLKKMLIVILGDCFTIDVSVHNVYEELEKRLKGREVVDVITEVFVSSEEMCNHIAKEAFHGHHNGRVKKNIQRECLFDLIVEKQALVVMVVGQENSIVKLEKVVEKLKCLLHRGNGRAADVLVEEDMDKEKSDLYTRLRALPWKCVKNVVLRTS
ncbi:hypothetical protein V8G54_020343 [Vigna mungo]|uniref:Uncharacterized protein n=1 Tax=Vigna mungo TaxID=3915 RepID=A0AAQ3NDK6_VIGMU